MLLPKVYENKDGNYPQFFNKPKMSYSFYNSWKEIGYKGDAIANYFLGIKSEGNVFTSYGGACGRYYETASERDGLSDFDITVIDKLERPVGALYESEIVLDRGSYVIQGFSDFECHKADGLTVQDLKTGAIKSKKAYYSAPEFNQTCLYSHTRALEGHEIKYSGVILLDRAGNGSDKHPLRLTGEIEYIPTPYSKERAEEFLKDFDKVTEEISYYYSVFLKYFK